MKNFKYLSIFVLAVAAVPAVCGVEGDSDYFYAVDDSGQNYGEQEYGLGSDAGYENSFDDSEGNFSEQDSEMSDPAADMTDADMQTDESDSYEAEASDADLGDAGDIFTESDESTLSEEAYVPEDQEMTGAGWAKTDPDEKS